ncbi:MAG TPA: hypothetical protein VGK48_21180 [Terriglobia bacterium]|jgi:hypothetical protein
MSNCGWFDSNWESPKIVLVGEEILKRAEPFIRGCENCAPDLAWLPFETLLDQVTGNAAEITEYMLMVNAVCPRCGAGLRECTLIAVDDASLRDEGPCSGDSDVFPLFGGIGTI